MKIIYFDGSTETCDTVEFSSDGKHIILDGCTTRKIITVLRIVKK